MRTRDRALQTTIIALLAVAVAAAAVYAWSTHRREANAREWRAFTSAVNGLSGRDRGAVKAVMESLGMHLRRTVRKPSDWAKAIDHVSPKPPHSRAAVVLKYTDERPLTRKCAFIYIGSDGRVSSVFTGLEYF